jgi:hypothetical protein
MWKKGAVCSPLNVQCRSGRGECGVGEMSVRRGKGGVHETL